LTTNQYPKS